MSIKTDDLTKERILEPRHHSAMSLRFQGLSVAKIAKELRLSASSIDHWFAKGGILFKPYKEYCDRAFNPTVKPEHTHTHAVSVAETIKNAAPGAIQTIIDLSSNAKREQVKFQASADILDRAGYMPVQKNINIHAVEEMGETELNSLVMGLLGKVEARVSSASGISAPGSDDVVVDVTPQTVAEPLEGGVDDSETYTSLPQSFPENVPSKEYKNGDFEGSVYCVGAVAINHRGQCLDAAGNIKENCTHKKEPISDPRRDTQENRSTEEGRPDAPDQPASADNTTDRSGTV